MKQLILLTSALLGGFLLVPLGTGQSTQSAQIKWPTPFVEKRGTPVGGLYLTLRLDKDAYSTSEYPWMRVAAVNCNDTGRVWFADSMMTNYYLVLDLRDERGNAVSRRTDVPTPQLTGNYGLVTAPYGGFYGIDLPLSYEFKPLPPGKYSLRVGCEWSEYKPDRCYPESLRPLLKESAIEFWRGKMESNTVQFTVK